MSTKNEMDERVLQEFRELTHEGFCSPSEATMMMYHEYKDDFADEAYSWFMASLLKGNNTPEYLEWYKRSKSTVINDIIEKSKTVFIHDSNVEGLKICDDMTRHLLDS